MLNVLFNADVVDHKKIVPVPTAYYFDVLERLRKKFFAVLHRDNAPSNTALRIIEFLANHKVVTRLRVPYNTEFALLTSFHFRRFRPPNIGQPF